MTNSGIKLDGEAAAISNAKFGKKENDFRAVKLIIDDTHTKVICKTTVLRKDTSFKDVVRLLDDEPGWVFFNADASSEESQRTYSDIIMLVWAPDNLKIKMKMLIASTTAVVKKQVDPKYNIQVTDKSEAQPKALAKEILSEVASGMFGQNYTLCNSKKEEIEDMDIDDCDQHQ